MRDRAGMFGCCLKYTLKHALRRQRSTSCGLLSYAKRRAWETKLRDLAAQDTPNRLDIRSVTPMIDNILERLEGLTANLDV